MFHKHTFNTNQLKVKKYIDGNPQIFLFKDLGSWCQCNMMTLAKSFCAQLDGKHARFFCNKILSRNKRFSNSHWQASRLKTQYFMRTFLFHNFKYIPLSIMPFYVQI